MLRKRAIWSILALEIWPRDGSFNRGLGGCEDGVEDGYWDIYPLVNSHITMENHRF